MKFFSKLFMFWFIYDITHDIIPYNFMQAAYVCRNIFSAFPPESFHLVLVNAFDSNVNHLLLVRHNGQILGIPDNGLITMILGRVPDEVVAIPFPPGFKKNIRNFTSLLVEAFSGLLSGVKLEKLGTSSVTIQEKHLMKPFHQDS